MSEAAILTVNISALFDQSKIHFPSLQTTVVHTATFL